MTSAWTAHTGPKNRRTHFELLGSRKTCTTACFVWGVKRCAHTSSPVTVDSSHSFLSVRHLGTQGAHTLRYPSSSWTVFASVLTDTSNATDGSRIANRQFSKTRSSIRATSKTRLWCVWPTACPVDHFRTLCTTFQYNALSLCHHSTPQSGEQVSTIKSYSHYEILRGAKFPVLLSLHINLSPEQTLPLMQSVACYP